MLGRFRSDRCPRCGVQARAHLCPGLRRFLRADFCGAGAADCGRRQPRVPPPGRAGAARGHRTRRRVPRGAGRAQPGSRSRRLPRAGFGCAAVEPAVFDRRKVGRAAGAQAHRAHGRGARTACGRRRARTGIRRFSTADLLGILDAEPERISPAALLRPVFQDFLFGTTAQVGGPAEIAYLAQSTVLFERILGRQTPPMARFSATLIEPPIAELLRRHELTLEQVFAEESAATLALRAGSARHAARNQDRNSPRRATRSTPN